MPQIGTIASFEWMAAPESEDALRRALKQLPPARLPDVYRTLRRAKFWARQDGVARATRRRTPTRAWLARRQRVPRDLDALEALIRSVYADADARRLFALRQLAGVGPAWRRSLGPGTERVLEAADQLRTAIANDPVLSAPIGQHRRGQPSRPWLRRAEEELRRVRVTKAAALDLLRLIGLKPE